MAVNVVSLPFTRCLTGGPGGPLCWALALPHRIPSATSLVSQTPSGFPRAPSAGCGLSHLISSISVSSSRQLNWHWNWTQLSYIIVQRPFDHPLDLWNRMFNRHQAEKTVMQYGGHSLPDASVYEGIRGFFSSSHFISQFPPTRFPLTTVNVSLPSGASPWMAYWAGWKVKIQHVYLC